MIKNIFDDYNYAIQKVMEEGIDKVKTNSDYLKLINSARSNFERSSIEQVPVPEFIKAAVEKEGLDDMIEAALVHCDMYMPYTLADIALNTWGVDKIFEMATDKSMVDYESTTLLNILSTADQEDVDILLVGLLRSSDSDLIKEEISEILALHDKDRVFELLSEQLSDDLFNVDLLLALVKVTRDTNRASETYALLKKAFLEADDKQMIAAIMADLKDPRAVPFLRGYIEKNKFELTKDEIASFASALHALGGSIDDFLGSISQTHH